MTVDLGAGMSLKTLLLRSEEAPEILHHSHKDTPLVAEDGSEHAGLINQP